MTFARDIPLSILVAGAVLLGCGPSGDQSPPAPAPVDSVESVPAPEPDSLSRDSVAVEPAQLACVPSLTVNGLPGDGRSISGGIPSRLIVEVTDCPHPKEEARDRAAGRLNFGGASSGFGSGQVEVRLHPVSQSAFSLGPKSPVVSEGDVKVEEQSFRLVTVLTKPSRRSTPTDRVDTPVRYKQTIQVRKSGEDESRAFVWVSFIPADAGIRNCKDEAGNQKCFGIIFRQ